MFGKKGPARAINPRHPPQEDVDPIMAALKPPPDETPEERIQRLQERKEAEIRSRGIDAYLAESKGDFERRKRAIKILLLGTPFRYEHTPFS